MKQKNAPIFPDNYIGIVESTNSVVYRTSSGHTPLKLRELTLSQQFVEAAVLAATYYFKGEIPESYRVLPALIRYEIEATREPFTQAVRDAFGRKKGKKNCYKIELHTELEKMRALIECNPLALKDIEIHYNKENYGNSYGKEFVQLLRYILNPKKTKLGNRHRYAELGEMFVKENNNKPFNGILLYSEDKSPHLPSFAYARTKQFDGLDRPNRTLEQTFQRLVALAKCNRVKRTEMLDFFIENLRNDEKNLPVDINAFTLGYHIVGGDFLNNALYQQAFDRTAKMLIGKRNSDGTDRYNIPSTKDHPYQKMTGRPATKFTLVLNNPGLIFNHPVEFRVQQLPVDVVLAEMTTDIVPPRNPENAIGRRLYLARRGVASNKSMVRIATEDGSVYAIELGREENKLVNELIGSQIRLFSEA